MAYEKVRKSHSGAKKGAGAWLPKKDAKLAAKKLARPLPVSFRVGDSEWFTVTLGVPLPEERRARSWEVIR